MPTEHRASQLGARLREMRRSLDMTQMDVAKFLGVDRSTYAYYETGVSQPSVITLTKLSQLYNVSLDYLSLVADVPTPAASASASSIYGLRCSQASNSDKSFSDNEQLLIAAYRCLPESKKQFVLEMIRSLAQNIDTL